MKKSIKIISITLLVLLLALFILPFVFKGMIKDLVIKEANKNLDAKLEVGKISLSFLRSFPQAEVVLNDLIITGKGDFEGDTLLIMKTLSVSTGLMDLFNGSPYKIKKIKIKQADVRLKVLADERANWDIIKESGNKMADETPEEGPSDFRLLLKSLKIMDSRLVYNDIFNSTYVKLEGINHQLSGDLGADFTTLKTQTNISGTYVDYEGINYLRDAVVDWKADLDADLVKYVYTFKENKLVINDFAISFDGTVGMPDEGYDLQLTFSTPDNTFKKFLSLVPAIYSREYSSVKTDGTLSFDGFIKGLYSDNIYPAFLVNLGVKDAWFQYPSLPASVNDINILARIESPGGDLDNTVVNVDKFSMNMAGNPLNARLLLKNPISDPYIDTRVEARLNLADIGKFYPLEKGEDFSGNLTADITLKGRLSDVENARYNAFEASGIFNSEEIHYTSPDIAQSIFIQKAKVIITPAYLDVPEFRATSGKSDFNLKGKLDNYLGYILKDGTLNGNFSLVSSMLYVNEMLDFPVTEPGVEDTSGISAFIVPAGIDFTLNVSAAYVEFLEYKINDLKGVIRIRDQQLLLDRVNMDMLGGNVEMSGHYGTIDPLNPDVDFILGMNSISIQETFRSIVMVKQFAPIFEKITGDFSSTFKLSGNLNSRMKPRLESIAGEGNLITTALKISNVNTLDQLSNVLKIDQLKELEVNGTKLEFQILDGVMDVKPFDFKALGIDMNLGGQTSLDQKIAYVMKMKIPRSMMGGAANNVLDELVAKAGQAGVNVQAGDYINVAALIVGTITDPQVKLDLAGTGKDIVESLKDQVQQQIEEEIEHVKDQARELGDNYLQQAEQQAQAILEEAQRQADEILKNAQKLADEAKKQAGSSADMIINEAKGSGFVTELAAKKSAEEVIKQGDKQAQNIMDEARKQSASLIDKARIEADKIKAEARAKLNQ